MVVLAAVAVRLAVIIVAQAVRDSIVAQMDQALLAVVAVLTRAVVVAVVVEPIQAQAAQAAQESSSSNTKYLLKPYLHLSHRPSGLLLLV